MFFKIFTLCVLVSSILSEDVFWTSYKEKYNHHFANETEHQIRYKIFKDNVRSILLHNVEASQGKHSFKLAVNKFAIYTNEEFVSMMNGYNPSKIVKSSSKKVREFSPIGDLPSKVDWRDKNLVVGVKDQAFCGSCWAFSAIASLEGQHAKATGQLVSLSEQNLVDCSKEEGNNGCDGGWMDFAFKYIEKQGIDTEDSYPYFGFQDDTCHFNKSSVGATMKDFVDIKAGDEAALKEAVANIGPISVAIDAGSILFQFYRHGVFDHPTHCHSTEDHLDHGVTVVGYGTDEASGKDYWLVKNSWSKSWGMNGYIMMSRNKNNQCGIATKASYPVV